MTEQAPAPRRLHPATLVSRWLRLVPQLLGGGAAYAAVVDGWGRILLLAVLAALLGVGIALIVWWRFRYTVRPNEIVIESGVFQRQRRVIPFSRVQDIAIERGLLARLFNTAKVKIETGGSAADEGDLDMISLADAQRLRDHIRRGHGETAVRAVEEEPLLFAMSFARLFHSGLFNFSLLFLAVIMAVLQNLEQFNLVDLEELFNPQRAGAVAGYLTLRTTLILAPLLILLGIVSGLVRTIARDFGFRLSLTGEAGDGSAAVNGAGGLRRRRGLFTLSEVVIPICRIQIALIESGPVTRQLGWFSLSFQTLGADTKEGGVQAAAPFARMEELQPIVSAAGLPMPPPQSDFVRIPRRALLRRAVPWLVVGVAAAPIAIWLAPGAGLVAAVMLLAALYGALRWRKHGFALGEDALFVSDGLFKRRLWIIPFDKAQTISINRGPLQRGLGLASLLVDTAGASMIRTSEIVDLDGAEADRLAGRLLERFYDGHLRPCGSNASSAPAQDADLS
ncbi:PH domain-containing protein [Sphingosinicella sp. CPCC 101087]|uniref:PH domain-containing protein n=1 Tax=Sphingosinicella sp. CPCC 101087 TaxID=2497754 RepID=UPI00101D0AD2|nr:PH domain-containing protein [Sphingosinicella sp. CPCC 101087]